MVEELSADEVHAAAERAIEDLLAAAGVTAPPVDAVALARRHLGLAASPARRPRGPAPVAPRAEPPEEERQWAAAREVGDHLKPAVLARLGLDPAGRRPLLGESLTNLLAARLLAPTAWLAPAARAAGWDLLVLRPHFATLSLAALAWRLLDLEEPCVITVVDNGAVTRRRSNAWPVRKELSPPEEDCRQQAARYARPAALRAGGWAVQAWPVHQPDWRCEVLRSVIEDEEEAFRRPRKGAASRRRHPEAEGWGDGEV